MIPPLTQLTASEITVWVAGISLTSAVIAAIIGSGSALLTAHLTRRAEDLRHRREIGIEIGRAKFEMAREMAQRVANATGEIVPVPSLDSHLVNGIKVMEILARTDLTADQIGRELSELVIFSQAVDTAYKEAKKQR